MERNMKCLTVNKKDRILSLYIEGFLQREIAEILGTSQPSISRAFNRFGIESTTNGKFKKMKDAIRTNKHYKTIKVPKNERHLHLVWKNGRTYEHRYFMEKKLGRKLKKGEVVHHKDHNPKNNDVNNLVLSPSHGRHTIDYNHYRI